MKIKKTNKIYGFYYYCNSCGRQIDYYEYMKNNGICDNCRYTS